jgi:hypothetical protein
MGYGFDSVAAILAAIRRIEDEVVGLDGAESLTRRRALIRETDERRLIATPANSSANELVIEAARVSILEEGRPVRIVHGSRPHVEPA